MYERNFAFHHPGSPFGDLKRSAIFSMFGRTLEKVLRINELKSIYSKTASGSHGLSFIDQALKALNVTHEIRHGNHMSIPQKGPVVVISNHPFGAIEGLILASILLNIRPDVKIMANYILGCIPELRDILVLVDPFGKKSSRRMNVKPLKESIRWVLDGGILGVFPAGSVSHVHLYKKEICDPAWHHAIAKIVRSTGAQVIPVFFDGTNSAFFHIAGMINSRLRTALLPNELLNKRNKIIQVRVGSAITFDALENIAKDNDLTAYLRFRTYALKHACTNTRTHREGRCMGTNEAVHCVPIVEPAKKHILDIEVRNIPEGQILIESGHSVVVYAKAHQISNVLYEIGRLREVTFRQAGEGTGKRIDLDRFDLYYTHLFVWNKERKEVVGAYRLGQVDAILERYGKNGLYSSSLFDYQDDFLHHIKNGLELGRSFIRAEYQRQYASLLLLWKGIGHFIAQNPRHKIIFGPVTISNNYSLLSKRLMVAFLKLNNFENELARSVRPKTPPGKSGLNEKEIQEAARLIGYMEHLSPIISDIEADKKEVPVLLKHYIKLGGKLLGFNIDRSFSNSLDGLILADLTKCDNKILKKYMGQMGFQAFHSIHNVIPVGTAA